MVKTFAGLTPEEERKKREEEIRLGAALADPVIPEDITEDAVIPEGAIELPEPSIKPIAHQEGELTQSEIDQGITINDEGFRVAPDGTILAPGVETPEERERRKEEEKQGEPGDPGREPKPSAGGAPGERPPSNLELARQQQETFQLASQIGRLDPSLLGNLAALREAPTNWEQAFTAGTIGAAPSILRTVGTFAAGGLLAGGPAVALVSAGIGLIAGIFQGVSNNVESQKKGEISASVDVLSAARTNMRQLAMLASQDPANAERYVQSYNVQLALVSRAHQQIKVETQGNLNSYIEDGTDILSDFELFLQPRFGTAAIYGQKLQAALLTGVPPTFQDEDFNL